MNFFDLVLWYLGIFGFSTFVVFYLQSFDDYLFVINVEGEKTFLQRCISYILTSKPATCIACLSLISSVALINFYFPTEKILTKTFICFSTYALSMFGMKFTDHVD